MPKDSTEPGNTSRREIAQLHTSKRQRHRTSLKIKYLEIKEMPTLLNPVGTQHAFQLSDNTLSSM
ncbi:hypothetical protein [Paraburkholderia antibiotica]|uniref:hypothetical protein n=1 Tax=Paraburkholderia antibiotica TaxID=2728839 RepID=UPI001980AA93|nr:hypothetical protein [Paraburkholderia antibiotica]